MSEPTKQPGFSIKFDLGLGGAIFWLMVFACIGDPDLLDAFIAWVQRQP